MRAVIWLLAAALCMTFTRSGIAQSESVSIEKSLKEFREKYNATTDSSKRAAAIQELQGLRDPKLVGALAGVLSFGADKEATAAMQIVRAIDHPDAVQALIDTFNNRNKPAMRTVIVQALGDSSRVEAFQFLTERIQRYSAAFATCAGPDLDDCRLLKPMVGALQKIGDCGAIPVLLKVCAQAQDYSVRMTRSQVQTGDNGANSVHRKRNQLVQESTGIPEVGRAALSKIAGREFSTLNECALWWDKNKERALGSATKEYWCPVHRSRWSGDKGHCPQKHDKLARSAQPILTRTFLTPGSGKPESK